jgi:hypothetical protein
LATTKAKGEAQPDIKIKKAAAGPVCCFVRQSARGAVDPG